MPWTGACAGAVTPPAKVAMGMSCGRNERGRSHWPCIFPEAGGSMEHGRMPAFMVHSGGKSFSVLEDGESCLQLELNSSDECGISFSSSLQSLSFAESSSLLSVARLRTPGSVTTSSSSLEFLSGLLLIFCSSSLSHVSLGSSEGRGGSSSSCRCGVLSSVAEQMRSGSTLCCLSPSSFS